MGIGATLGRRGLWATAIAIAIGALALLYFLTRSPASSESPAGASLTAFESDDQLRRFLAVVAARQVIRLSEMPAQAPTAMFDVESAPVPLEAGEPASITNTQEAGVDEGGIVKVHGHHLVILRRGRLFTVSTAGGGLRAVDSIDAFPPGASGQGDWYDEMLISDDRVIVIGYSYGRGGTEINRFRLSPDGRLRFEDAWHLKSNDYYSSRNYASRLIGTRLVLYTPLYLNWRNDPLEALPGLRRWRPGIERGAPFRPIAGPAQVYVAPDMGRNPEARIDALHSVTICDLSADDLACSAVAVLGPESRTFYVSPSGVYLWIADWMTREPRRGESRAFLYRLPFGGAAPTALAAEGMPVDQFSFREDANDGMINVLLRAEGGGDAMGGPEVTGGGIALLRVPIASLGDGSRAAPESAYTRLPSPGGEAWNFHNRFVGDHVLYGAGSLEEGGARTVVVAPVRGGTPVRLQLAHSVDRIEALGRDALVVGSGAGRSLGFSAIELGGGRVARGDVFTLPAASEGETRSHAFFFRADAADGASGLLGLPVSRAVDPAYARFFGSAASMLFLRRQDRRFAPAGELGANPSGTADDGCQASCTDWYGNARPIFLRGRIFALLGYELVEGRFEDGQVRELARVNFSPAPVRPGT